MDKNNFTLEDFKAHLEGMSRMGSFSEVLKMIPGSQRFLGQMPSQERVSEELKKVKAIINSMTKKERQHIEIINGSRRIRIAQGSGTHVSDINKLTRQFLELKKMMKNMSKFGRRNP